MSNWGTTKLKIVFVEGYNKRCTWPEIREGAESLAKKCYEALKAIDHEGKLVITHLDVVESEIALDEVNKCRCYILDIPDFEENFFRHYFPMEMGFNGYAELFELLCKRHHCIIDFSRRSESTGFCIRRVIISPKDEVWASYDEEDVDEHYDYRDSKLWVDVLKEHYFKDMVEIDLNSVF